MTEETRVPNLGGRPSIYSDELASEICERLVNGESLNSICKDKSMPCVATIFSWLDKKPEFLKRYEFARENQADTLADQMIDIADDGRNDWMEKKDAEGNCIGWQVNGEYVQRSRLRLDARKWIASKLKPKKYGEKTTTELTGKDGGAIAVKDISLEEAARRMAYILTTAASEQAEKEQPT